MISINLTDGLFGRFFVNIDRLNQLQLNKIAAIHDLL